MGSIKSDYNIDHNYDLKVVLKLLTEMNKVICIKKKTSIEYDEESGCLILKWYFKIKGKEYSIVEKIGIYDINRINFDIFSETLKSVKYRCDELSKK